MTDDADDNESDASLLEAAKKRHKLARDAWANQRKREKADLAFQIPERQWSAEARQQRQGTVIRGVPSPARPCLSINKLDGPIRRVFNQARSAHLGIQLHPISPEGNDDNAQAIKGLYRSIERESNADIPRLWALDRAVKAGIGWYRIVTEYDQNSDNPTDQVIRIKRILNQDSVLVDPSAQETDFRDAEFIHVANYLSVRQFKKRYPGVEIPLKDEWELESGDEPGWVKYNDEGQPVAVMVVEEWRRDIAYEDVEYTDAEGEKQTRKRESVEVECVIFTANKILERYDWDGHYLPFVPVLGRELQPVDGERIFVGIIGPNKDSQQAFNFAATAALETLALEPRSPVLGTPKQFEGYEDVWREINTRNFTYVPYNMDTTGGTPAPPPSRMQVDTQKANLSAMVMQLAEGWVESGTHTFDPALGRDNPRERSGRAIQALQDQTDTSTSDFLASLADVSMVLEATIILDLLRYVYDRPGRIERILDENDQSSAVMLNQPYTEPQKGGMPTPVPEGMPMPPGAKHHDLSKARYAISISVGKSLQSKMEAASEFLGQILSSRPEFMPLFGDLFFKSQDAPYAQEMATRVQKLSEQQMPFLWKDDQGPGPSPQQMQAMQAQMQAMGQQMQMMQQQLETESYKAQARIQEVQLNTASKERIAASDQATRMRIEQIKAQLDAMRMQHEGSMQSREMAHEAGLEAQDVPHEVAKAAGAAAAQTAAQVAAATLAPLNLNPQRGETGAIVPDEGAV